MRKRSNSGICEQKKFSGQCYVLQIESKGAFPNTDEYRVQRSVFMYALLDSLVSIVMQYKNNAHKLCCITRDRTLTTDLLSQFKVLFLILKVS